MSEQHHHHHDLDSEELTVLLDYMLKHNQSHTDELKKIAEKLKASGKAEAADEALAAVSEYEKGNARLASALEKAGE